MLRKFFGNPEAEGVGSLVFAAGASSTSLVGHPITRDEVDRFTTSNINGFIYRN
jgi:hypothetical protein